MSPTSPASDPPARRLRIAEVAPPDEAVPPLGYGGTERIVDELVRGLLDRGHEVTTFASGDSHVPGRHVVTVPRALRPAGTLGESLQWNVATVAALREELERGSFDVVHLHLDLVALLAAAAIPVPTVITFHGRLDHPAYGPAMRGSPAKLVAISAHQAATRPEADWAAVIHHGLSLDDAPFERRRDDALVFVGRITPEKGALEALEVARISGRPLRVIAKEPTLASERAYLDDVFKAAIRDGDDVELLGELVGAERDHVLASSHALLMPSAWPEPFGLVAIEALACGTPVIAHRSGGIPEIVREGVDGFFGDDALHMAHLVARLDELDREAIRESALDRFSARRMTLAYEAVLLDAADGVRRERPVRVETAPGRGGRQVGEPHEIGQHDEVGEPHARSTTNGHAIAAPGGTAPLATSGAPRDRRG
jgi:glycosyltransferase involved in cell wall biosynthesis